MALAIITLFISVILLFYFLFKRPYSNGFKMKLFLILYTFFCWTCFLCIGGLLLKNSNFKSGIILLILGYPIILIGIALKDSELGNFFLYIYLIAIMDIIIF